MKDKIKLLLEKYINYVNEMDETINSVGKKQILIDLVNNAKRDQLWDLWYWLSNAGYYTEDNKNLKDFAINIIENYYKDLDVNYTSYNEKTNHEIENAIFNALHKDKEEYLNEALELHDTLNPSLWVDDELKPDVAEALLNIANTFIKNLGFPIDVADIRIVGSNASYNYNNHSDIDLHIISNFDINYIDNVILQQLYNNEKNSFNNKHDITVKGIPVELYVEDMHSMNATNGSYSLLNNKWIKYPEPIEYEIPDYSEDLNIELDKAEQALLSNNIQTIKDEINHIYLMRKDGLAREGEASIGNLVFKEMRNIGVQQKLADKYYELESRDLSLESENLKEYRNFKDLKPKVEQDDDDLASIEYWKEQIKKGNHRPILINSDNDILDGNHTIIAYQELNIEPPYVYLGTRDEFYKHVANTKNIDALDAINDMIKDGTATLLEWGEETSEDIEYRNLIKTIRDGYGNNFNIPPKAGLPALRKIAASAQKIIDKRKENNKVNLNKKDVVGYEHYNNDNFKFYFKDGSTSILNYNQAKPYLDVQDYNDKDREEYELDHIDECLIERAYYNDVTTDELNNNEVKLIVVYKDDRSEKSFNNIKELFKYVKECGGFSTFKGCYWCIRSDYKEGEFYLERDRFSKGGWRWYDVNGDDVQGQTYRTPRGSKQENAQLNEVNLVDIINDSKATDPKRIKLAQTLYTEYKGVDSDGTILFETDSQTRSNLGHQQKIFYEGFFNLLDKVDENESISEMDVVDILTGDVNIYCSCESFLYWAWAYKSWKDGYGLMKELRAPTKNNRDLKGGACKHILSVLELINRSDTIFNKITEDLNTLFSHYKKADLTKKEIERLQNELKTMQAPNLQTSANNETISKTE